MAIGTALAMNKLITKRILSTTIALLVLVATFWFGGHVASNRTARSIYGVQAILAFRHLKAYEETYSYLESDCISQAMQKIKFLINEQKSLMAEYVQSNDDSKFREYVSLRNPGLIEELRHYPINWDRELTITGCD